MYAPRSFSPLESTFPHTDCTLNKYPQSSSVLAIDPGHPASPTAGENTTPEEKDILIQDLEVRLATAKQQLEESQVRARVPATQRPLPLIVFERDYWY